VREVHIYVEGGGDDSDSLAFMRDGFGTFLRDLRDCARRKGIRWKIVACGGRDQAFDDFAIGMRRFPAMLHILLIDSEEPVTAAISWQHLQRRDGWARPTAATDEQCHLMVQTMEAWFIADADTLAAFYGQHFNRAALPRTANVEAIEKSRIERALESATRRTTKGSYHKIRHGAELLKRIDPAKVRAASHHCDALFTTLATQMGGC
jgi:hypothetical protein